MKKIVFILLFLFSALYSSAQSRDDYNIYTAIIKDWQKGIKEEGIPETVITKRFGKQNIDKEIFNEIRQNPVPRLGFASRSGKEDLEILLREERFINLVQRFAKEYSMGDELKADRFDELFNVTIVDNKLIDNLLKNGDNESWNSFYRKYPDSYGYFQFSKVTYSDDYALVYFVSCSKPLVGAGKIVVMRKSGRKWNIVGDFLLWQA